MSLSEHDLYEEDGETLAEVANVTLHPRYGEPYAASNDLALLELTVTTAGRPDMLFLSPCQHFCSPGASALLLEAGARVPASPRLPEHLRG